MANVDAGYLHLTLCVLLFTTRSLTAGLDSCPEHWDRQYLASKLPQQESACAVGACGVFK